MVDSRSGNFERDRGFRFKVNSAWLVLAGGVIGSHPTLKTFQLVLMARNPKLVDNRRALLPGQTL